MTFAERGDGDLSLTWVFGDGATSSEESPTHAYEAGTWTAFLIVEQSVGFSSASEAIEIEVSPGPNRPPVSSFRADPGSGGVFAPASVRFAFTGHDPDGNLESIAWEVDGEPLVFDGEDYGDGGSIVVWIADAAPREIRCTVRDSLGLSATSSMTYLARPPAIVDLRPHPLPPAIRAGERLEVVVEGRPGARGVIFYGREPLSGGEFHGTPLGLGSDFKVFGDVDEDGFPIPFVFDDGCLARIERQLLDLPGRYFFQVLAASDDALEEDRILSFVSPGEKEFYVDVLPATCEPGETCFFGHLFLKKPVEISGYDADREAPGLQPKPGFEVRAGGRYAVRFERVPVGHVEAEIVGVDGDEVRPVSAPFYVRDDGFFEAPLLPDAPRFREHFVRVVSRSRRANVQTGPLLFRGYADFLSYETAWDLGNLDSYGAADPIPARGWGTLTFVEWLEREAGAPLAEEIAAAEARISEAESAYRDALAELDLRQRRRKAAFESAIATSMGALGVALDTLRGLVDDLNRLGRCFTSCRWWERLILVCPTRCVISFTIDVLNTMIDTVITTIRTIERCIEALRAGIAFNDPDRFTEDLVGLEAARDEAYAWVVEARAALAGEEEQLAELLDRRAFLDRFRAWVEGLPGGCAGDCEDLLHRMLAHRGGEFIPLYFEDERFFRLIRRPKREISSAILREHPGRPFGASVDFGDIVVSPEGHLQDEREYQRAFLFLNILERVERAFDFVFANSPAYKAETDRDRDSWRHVVDVVYPSTAGPRSFCWGFDFDGNRIADLALAPRDALDDAVVREYGRLVMDRMLRLTPLPLPGRADDYEKFAASCADDGRSPGASYAEGWSRFFVEAVAPAPGNIIEGPRNVQFLDAPCCPCGFREGYREEAWIARILWELYKEKPPPVIPGVDPGLYPFDDLALAIAGPGVGPPGDICAYQEALAALRGPDVRVVEIYRRNMVGVLQGGRCGGVPEDRDADGVRDAADNCPFVPNRAQEDEDGDGIGDACDGCPLADPDGVDLDYDGVGDRCEGPPLVSVEAAPSRGSPPLEVRLTGSAADPGGRAVSWTWEVDGVPAGEGPAIVVTITSVGLHTAVLRVVDDDGLEGSGAATIAVGFEIPVAGNVNGDLRIDISDPIALLSFLFLGGAGPACKPIDECADANADGRVDLSDSVHILNYLFLGGPPPGHRPG